MSIIITTLFTCDSCGDQHTDPIQNTLLPKDWEWVNMTKGFSQRELFCAKCFKDYLKRLDDK